VDILKPGQAQDGDIVLDGRTQAFQRVGETWRHLDLVLVESGMTTQPEGELVILRRRQ
jgi:hypothetical protein